MLSRVPSFPLPVSALLAASLGAVSLACAAQTNPANPTPEPVPELASVTVQAHYNNSVGSSDAASAGVVDGARLTDLPLLRPGEVLETVPGMVVTQHSGDGKANQYWLRGYNLDHGTDFASFIDGVPVNMPSHAHGQGYTDLNDLIPELVQTIRYRKGPYFADSGDFASAGSAQIEYRSHLDHGISAISLGAYGYRRGLLADSVTRDPAQPGTGPRLLYALELEHSNGPWATPEDLRKTNALLRLSDGNSAHGWSADAMAYAAQWNATDQVPLALIASGQLCRFCALDPSDGGNTHRAGVSAQWHDHGASGYSQLSVYARHEQLQLWSDFRFYEDNPQRMDQFAQWEQRNLVGGQALHGWQHQLLGQDSSTEVGLQVRHDHIHVGLLNTQNRIPWSIVDDDHVRQTLLSAYVQNSTTWSPWLRSLVGLRADRLELGLSSAVLPQNDGSARAAKWQPKLSLIFGPWAQTELFANAGTGFHSNDARGVIERLDPTSVSVAGSGGPTAAQPVPALVSSHGAELGLRSQAIAGWQTSLALWRLNSDSELVYNADADIGSTSPNAASRRVGVEWNNSLTLTSWLLIDFQAAWTRARYAQMNANGALGDMIPNAVSRTAQLAATAQRAGWSGGLEWRYIGPYPLTQDGSQVAASAIVANLRLTRHLTPQLSLSADVLNVLNRRYFDIAYNQDYQSSPASATLNPNGITVHPGEPRQLRLGLLARF